MATVATVSAHDGRQLAYCEWGPPGGGPVFVLHGTPGSRLLRHVGGEYERTGTRAITYDRPGYGRSTRLPGRTVAHSAEDIAAIADHLGLATFSIAGISGGGPSALAAAAAMPGRVVRCATIVGAGPHDADDLGFLDGMSAEERAEWDCALQGEKCLTGQFFRDLKAWVETLPDSQDFPEGDRLMLSEAFREGLLTADGLVDDYASLLQPWGVDLARVECPVKVMIARDDRSVPPAHGHWLVKHVPKAEAVLVDGGHFGPRDEPEERLLNWLTNGSIHPADSAT